jgi:sialic acid synthase SpsE
VFIIGKGPSLDVVDCAALPSGVVINLNDSERVRAGDVGVFSANWVRHSLHEDGFRCGFYLAGKPLSAGVPHALLPPIPIELDDEGLSILRLDREEFFDEPFVLLNALKIASRIAEYREAPVDVYLLGFDFTTVRGALSKKAGTDFSGAADNEREAMIAASERGFRQFVHFFQAGDRLRLHHVGVKDYSDFSPASFNRRICGIGAVRGARPIDLANPDRVLVVAELTNNHLGDVDHLVEMIERAKESGADLIKVQKRHVDTFYTAEQLASFYWSPFGTTFGDYRRGVELNDDQLDLLDETCRRCEIEWFSSVLDFPSFEAIQRFRPRLLKIPSTISNDREFHARLVDRYRGGVVVSTGYTPQEYVDYVLDTFGANEVVYLLHCISAYPAPRQACNLAVVRFYQSLGRQHRQILPGYSSHDLGSLGCMLAVAGGARMVEKHVKLGDTEWIHFDKVALDLATDEFAKFVHDVRVAEEMTGSEVKRVLDCENHKYHVRKAA